MKKYKEPKIEEAKFKISPFWIAAIASALAREHKVVIRKGPNWALNLKSRELVYTDEIGYFNEENVLAVLLHEVGHLRFSDMYDPKTQMFKEAPEAGHLILNLMEDYRIDYIMEREYQGAAEIMEAMNQQAIAEAFNYISGYEKRVEDHKIALAEHKKNGSYDLEILAKLAGLNPEKINKVQLDEFKEKFEPPEPERINPIKECLFVASLHYFGLENSKIMKDYSDQKLKDRAKLVYDAVVLGDPEHMSSTAEIQKFSEEKIYPILKDLIKKNPDGSEKKFDQLQAGSGQFSPSAKGKTKANMDKEFGQGQKPSKNPYAPGDTQVNYEQYLQQISSLCATSAARMDRILKDNKFDRLNGRFRSGSLNNRRLYKHKTNDFRLFQRKNEKKNKDYAFSLLLDCSGSMNGKRIEESMKGVVLLSETLSRIEVPYEIHFFSDGHEIGKSFKEDLNRKKVSAQAGKVWSGGTDIGKPYKKALEDLEKRPEQKKIFIVLTDGSIDGTDADSIRKSLHKLSLQTHVYGLGIGIDLENIFGKSRTITVDDCSQIMPRFAAIMKRHIKSNL